MIDPLAIVRAIHFAAAIMVAGAGAFSVIVAEPAWQRSAGVVQSAAAHRSPVVSLTWLGLVAALASAMAWLALVAAEITGGSWTDAIGDGTAYAVLTDTQFGFVLQLRLLLGVALAVPVLSGFVKAAGRAAVAPVQRCLWPAGADAASDVAIGGAPLSERLLRMHRFGAQVLRLC